MPTKTLKQLYADLRTLNKLSKNSFGAKVVPGKNFPNPPNANCDRAIRSIIAIFTTMCPNTIRIGTPQAGNKTLEQRRREMFDIKLNEDADLEAINFRQKLYILLNPIKQNHVCMDRLKAVLRHATRYHNMYNINLLHTMQNDDILWIMFQIFFSVGAVTQ